MIFLKTVFLFLFINYFVHCTGFGLKIERDKFAMMMLRVGKILGKCTSPMVDYTGVIRYSGSYSDLPHEFISNVPIISLEDSENNTEFEGQISDKRRKESLSLFMILTFSPNNFQSLIRKLRKTVFWEPQAQYLILDEQTELTGCQNALTFLNASWVEELLYSTYFCVDPEEGFIMYTYNPYTRKAPDSWKEINPSQYTFKNRTWSLFQQKLIPGRTTCQDFNFDKTRSAGGYPINALVISRKRTVFINESATGIEQLSGPEGVLVKVVLKKLNTTLNLSVHWNSSNWPSFYAAVKHGDYDIILNARFLYDKYNMSLTYPHEISGLGIMTQRPGRVNSYKRILIHMNPILLGFIFFVFVVSSLVLYICTRKGLIHATLEAYRVLLGTSTIRPPRRNPLRIYLTSVIVLFTITNALFQSSLSSLLTIPVYHSYINGRKDLKNHPEFVIYVSERHRKIIYYTWMESRLRTIDDTRCVEVVKKDPLAACIADHKSLMMDAYNAALHVGKLPFSQLYLTFVMRSGWPLRERFNSILQSLTETGIVQYLREKPILNILQTWKSVEKERSSKSVFHVMKLADLIFAFYILLFGLSLATLVFFFELYVAKRQKPLPRRRIRKSNQVRPQKKRTRN